VTDKHKTPNVTPREPYEPPMVIRLSDMANACGGCHGGSAVAVCTDGSGGHKVGYRQNGFSGICVTGKAATEGCNAGVGVL